MDLATRLHAAANMRCAAHENENLINTEFNDYGKRGPYE